MERGHLFGGMILEFCSHTVGTYGGFHSFALFGLMWDGVPSGTGVGRGRRGGRGIYSTMSGAHEL